MGNKKNNSRKIGLALGGGGPRGLAHIGVIKALEEAGISVQIITGTSAGSLVGGLYAINPSASELEKFAHNVTLNDLATIFGDIGRGSGVIKGNKLENYLNALLHEQKIENLKIPFAAIATDISSGKAVTIRSGNLAKAIRASSAIPGIFDTIKIDNHLLSDGGISKPVPIQAAYDLGADFVIAVNLDTYNFISQEKPSLAKIGITAINLLRFHLAREMCKNADFVITPQVASIQSTNLAKFLHGEEIIKLGYKAAKASLPALKKALKLKVVNITHE